MFISTLEVLRKSKEVLAYVDGSLSFEIATLWLACRSGKELSLTNEYCRLRPSQQKRLAAEGYGGLAKECYRPPTAH